MNEQEQELKVARILVGAFTALSAWWIWNTIGLSVLVVQSASPNLSATGFSIGVTAMEFLGPIFVAVGFVLHKTGAMVIATVARILARLSRGPEPVNATLAADPEKFVSRELVNEKFSEIQSALKVSQANDKKLDARLKAAELQIKTWAEEQ